MANKHDDIFLEHIEDLKTHEGFNVVREHIEEEQKRKAIAIVTQQTEDHETQFNRGFWAGLRFALNAPAQIYEQRVAEIGGEEPKKGKR
ncbi:MAG: hypothetical protein WBV94_02725 [Blastocatellia bacterium]